MGVCCIVFDIDEMFEFFMNFLNIEKNKINLIFSKFHVFFVFHAISNIKKKIWCRKNSGGGGGGVEFFFLEKNSFSFHILCYFQNIKKSIEKCPFTYWLNGMWFLQIVDRDSWNLYPLYPLFPCSDFVSQMWGWLGGGGGGGVMFFSHFMLFPTFIEKNLGIQNNYFSFNVFFVFFFVCWKYWKVPLHLQLLVKWEVVSPNSRYREFYHEIGNIWKVPLHLLVK